MERELYREAIKSQYSSGKKGVLKTKGQYPTQAEIKNACKKKIKEDLTKTDRDIIFNYFGYEKEDITDLILENNRAKFLAIIRFLQGKNTRDDEPIDLLALLVDFNPRPLIPIINPKIRIDLIPENVKNDEIKSIEFFKKFYNEYYFKMTQELQKAIEDKAKQFLLFKEVFNLTIKAKELDKGLEEQLNFLFNSSIVCKSYKIGLVSALSVSMIENFSNRKGDLLIRLILENEAIIWEKALIGLMLAFNFNKTHTNLSNITYVKFQELITINRIQNGLLSIANFFLNDNFRFNTNNQETAKRNEKIYLWFLPKTIEEGKNTFVSVIPEINFSFKIFGDYRASLTYDEDAKGVKFVEGNKLKIKLLNDEPYSHKSNSVDNFNFYLKEIILAITFIPSVSVMQRKDDSFSCELTIIKPISEMINRQGVLGGLNYIKGKFDLALPQFLEDRLLNQDQGMLLSLGNIYIRKSEYKKAVGYLKRAVQINPTNIDSLINLGYAFSSEGKQNLALKYLKTAYDLILKDKNYKNNHNKHQLFCYIGRCYYKKFSKKALLYYLRGYRFIPNDCVLNRQLGDFYIRYKKYDKALFFFKKSLKFSNQDKKASRLIILHNLYLFNIKDIKIAKKYLAELERTIPNSSKLYERYIYHYTVEGNYNLVITYIKTAISNGFFDRKFYKVYNYARARKSSIHRKILNNLKRKLFFEKYLLGKILYSFIERIIVFKSSIENFKEVVEINSLAVEKNQLLKK